MPKIKTPKIKKDYTIDADKLWKIAWTYIKTVVDTMREPFLILDEGLRVLSANRRFYTTFHTTIKETEGQRVYNLGNGQWNIPKLKILLEDILPKHTHFEDFKVEHDFPKIGLKIMMLNARQIHTTDEKRPIMLLAMEDITKQVELEDKMRQYTRELRVEVSKRTAELEVRVEDLERMNKTMIGRELKMVELKKEIEKLRRSVKNGNGNDKGKNGSGKNGKHKNGRHT